MPLERPSEPVRQQRVLVISPHNSYRSTPFIDAARKLRTEILFASEGAHSIVSAYSNGIHVDLGDTRSSTKRILEEHQRFPFSGVVGTDDSTTELAASIARRLGLPHNPPSSVRTATRKDLARECLRNAQLRVPGFGYVRFDESIETQSTQARYPCVLKPISLSASRGVIRANNSHEFIDACHRIRRLLVSEAVNDRDMILVEDYIPGREVAVEGMLYEGVLNVLAIFDKPDPLEGPYFEETYYISPSRLDEETQTAIGNTLNEACLAFGLREGPIHGECRINEKGVWIIEVAARTIGGLCARLLSLGTGSSLEELVISHAIGQQTNVHRKIQGGAGVLMIPTRSAGILRRVEGIEAARSIRYIQEVTLLVREGYQMVPWPEGSSYFGFIFALAPTPDQAETALRNAYDQLEVVVAPLWKLN